MAEDYVIRVLGSPLDVDAAAWDALLQTQPNPSPFMRHAYLAALHASGSAAPATGWTPHFITLCIGDELVAACALYEKIHSYGEYVFDWAWANAYAQHGLPYYPKAVAAVPFTPVPGARLMARDAAARVALVKAMVQWCDQSGMSSLHLLFANEEDAAACTQAGLMLRHTVQFHWTNIEQGYPHFDAFLASLSQEKRKKIRQERRKVAEAGVSFRWSLGQDISPSDWDFFYRCYERTYLEHGNAPYLSRDFFHRMASTMAEHWLLFIAERGGKAIASSLIALDAYTTGAVSQNTSGEWAAMRSAQVKEEPAKRAGDTEQSALPPSLRSEMKRVAYGRYWGALERVDCLHFEACYYQPLQWCIEHGYHRFEGGAQGEHKMARALLPVKTTSAHWLAHPAFADAVARFLEREDQGISNYLDDLRQRSPFKPVD
ncbi:N-acetyltransferase [Rhodoferax sp. AJA081-3]|uniref:GNAT family N-acetyltransferase n=1 Tax=Rhodoferax sp. AJA081-3 TaxID=2752316 RepID=UPI001AE035CB|nr:GNAT family N-acetyltransferase [Rhodoferax sp. AJA081-3]QTN29233.1 N-acetyltransferase [Rhodoferax sp. AJA081-3]